MVNLHVAVSSWVIGSCHIRLSCGRRDSQKVGAASCRRLQLFRIIMLCCLHHILSWDWNGLDLSMAECLYQHTAPTINITNKFWISFTARSPFVHCIETAKIINKLSVLYSSIILVFLSPGAVTHSKANPSAKALNEHTFIKNRNFQPTSRYMLESVPFRPMVTSYYTERSGTVSIRVNSDDLEWPWKAGHEVHVFFCGSPYPCRPKNWGHFVLRLVTLEILIRSASNFWHQSKSFYS